MISTRVGSAAIVVGFVSMAPAAPETTPDVLGSWSAVVDGSPEILRDFAGADGVMSSRTA